MQPNERPLFPSFPKGNSPMNAAQLRRLEEKLTEAEVFFLDGSTIQPALQTVRDDLRAMLGKVVAERVRAELKDSRHPFSKRAAL